MGRRVCRFLTIVYLLFYLASLVTAVVGSRGMLGVAPDSFLASYLVILGMPWVLVLAITDVSSSTGLFVVGVAPLINIVIASLLCPWKRHRRKS